MSILRVELTVVAKVRRRPKAHRSHIRSAHLRPQIQWPAGQESTDVPETLRHGNVQERRGPNHVLGPGRRGDRREARGTAVVQILQKHRRRRRPLYAARPHPRLRRRRAQLRLHQPRPGDDPHPDRDGQGGQDARRHRRGVRAAGGDRARHRAAQTGGVEPHGRDGDDQGGNTAARRELEEERAKLQEQLTRWETERVALAGGAGQGEQRAPEAGGGHCSGAGGPGQVARRARAEV